MRNKWKKLLVDNKVRFGKYYLSKSRFSYYMEDKKGKVLFDVGYSGLFIKNADLMNVNLNDITHICLFHGYYNDHMGDLYARIREFEINLSQNSPQIIAHEGVFKRKVIQYSNKAEFGICNIVQYLLKIAKNYWNQNHISTIIEEFLFRMFFLI